MIEKSVAENDDNIVWKRWKRKNHYENEKRKWIFILFEKINVDLWVIEKFTLQKEKNDEITIVKKNSKNRTSLRLL